MKHLLLLALLSLASAARAEVSLPGIFSSHMVIQQNSDFLFWGWGAPNDAVIVSCSWLSGKEFRGKIDPVTLRWSVNIPVPAADLKPHRITIKGGWSDIILDDVLFGEVWVCSGQSNMEWQPAWGNVEITEAQYEASNDSLMRFFSVPRMSRPTVQEDCRSEWKRSTRETMVHFSAAAYFFGRELRDKLGVPVGLVNTSWGGTPIESWMHEKDFGVGAPFQLAIDEHHPVWNYGRSGSLWNGMIAPLTTLKIKGFLWYQGETNTYNPGYYAQMLEQLLADWRQDFNNPDLPFYYAQIAPWRYSNPREGAAVRDEQRRALKRLRNAGMVVLSDIGNIEDIHPHNKADVGKRFAAWALANTYGKTEICYSGPLYREAKVENNQIRLYFDYADKGLVARGDELSWFEIAGTDRKFHPAKAVIDGSTVLVSAKEVPQPLAVRYAFDNIAEANLFNTDGLPASCFRSDDWPAIFPPASFKVGKVQPNGDALVDLTCSNAKCRIQYTVDGSEPAEQNGLWANTGVPLTVHPGQKIVARVYDANGFGADLLQRFELEAHKGNGKKVTCTVAAAGRFPGSAGDYTLVDGLHGNTNLNDLAWAGYEGTSPEWTIDLGAKTSVKQVRASFLLSTGDWIFAPEEVVVSISDDGVNFKEIGRTPELLPTRHLSSSLKTFTFKVDKKTRFVRVYARNTGVLPAWHQGAGQPAWIFADEIFIN